MSSFIDTSGNSSDPATATARLNFDKHLDTCNLCRPRLCETAESLWRTVTLTALRAHVKGGA